MALHDGVDEIVLTTSKEISDINKGTVVTHATDRTMMMIDTPEIYRLLGNKQDLNKEDLVCKDEQVR